VHKLKTTETQKMNAKELAALLTGREYRREITREEEAQAKSAGLVVAFGASDDLLELRGAIHDEAGAYDGGKVRVDHAGVIPSFEDIDRDDEEELRRYFQRENGGVDVEALWNSEPGYSWVIKPGIPHETFEIVEDGEPFCRGIVFTLADLPADLSKRTQDQQPGPGAAYAGYSAMQPHEQRVVDEQAELDGKRVKLEAFLGTPTFAGLPTVEQGRLIAQCSVMQAYSEILGDRIAAFAPT
jgi:hypothetical protein